VKFGGIAAIVGEEIIHALREAVVDEETVEIRTHIEVGTEVQVLQGAFSGIKAIVTQVLPAQARVKVLLELLGMEREVEIAESGVLPRIAHPLAPV
jgi:transcription antitermination factor NusG